MLIQKMSPDLDLDPSDPLNLLLNNTSYQSPEDDESSTDWSQFSTLWADPSPSVVVGLKPSSGDPTTMATLGYDDLGSLGMDMDGFDPSMTIEPSALHYDYAKFARGSPFSSLSSSSSSFVHHQSTTTTPTTTTTTTTSPTSTSPTSGLPRPKTSHTTIERRYRTNLNARIQSLRMAVPALRVLDDKECGRKIKKNVKGGVVVKGFGIGIIDSEDGSVVDVIDERGFVDGVKVARKCSKANVLGKAVEYIRVLKKREHRLRAEQAGLKALIGGLVGGPALVEEWEREWKMKFGGEEQDEVEGEAEDGDDEDSEDEEGEEEELGKKRKRAKTSPTPKVSSAAAAADRPKKKSVSPTVGPNDQVPEKRKRGRPRKVLPSTVVPVAPRSGDHPILLTTKQDEATMQQQTTLFNNETQWLQHQQPQPQQFLFAVFALFSFFNSPLTSSYSTRPDHSHTGTVLNALHPPLAYAPDIISQFTAPPPPNNTTPAWTWQNYIQVFHLLVSVMVLASFVGSWLGISFGFGFGFNKKAGSVRGSLRDGDKAIGRRQGGVDWVKMGEQSVAEGKATLLSIYERIQIYRSVSRKSETSVSDLATLALVARSTTGVFSGLGRRKGSSIWGVAQDLVSGGHPKPPTLKISEKLVFETLSVDEALDRLALASASGDSWTKERENEEEDGRVYTPLEVLGCLIVRERVKKHMGRLFVQVVAANTAARERAIITTMVNDEEEAEYREEEAARRMTVDATRELGGSVERLGKAFERVWKTTISVEDDELLYFVGLEESTSSVDDDDEIKALFTALVLYRRAFGGATQQQPCDPSSTLLSPPPSPSLRGSVKYARMLLELRKALGNRVFEDDVVGEDEGNDDDGCCRALGLEDARDRVVDMIVDVERREKRGVDTPF